MSEADSAKGDSTTLLASYNRAQTLHTEYTGTTPISANPPSANTAIANRRVFDKVWEEVQRLVAAYRLSLTRKLKDIKGIGSTPQTIDTILDGIEYPPKKYTAHTRLPLSCSRLVGGNTLLTTAFL